VDDQYTLSHRIAKVMNHNSTFNNNPTKRIILRKKILISTLKPGGMDKIQVEPVNKRDVNFKYSLFLVGANFMNVT
jgi:hypothetical protein